jgi:hypothetical protein
MFTFFREISSFFHFNVFVEMLLFQAITQLFPEPFLIPLEMATGLSWPNDIITM